MHGATIRETFLVRSFRGTRVPAVRRGLDAKEFGGLGFRASAVYLLS